MRTRRWLSMLLALCMVVSLLPATVSAEENVLYSDDVYNDITLETATGTLNGSGTELDPFQIWTVDDLYLINYVESWNYWNSKNGEEFRVYYYKQMADLDLSDASKFSKTYGYITANFGGIYDGNNFKISGMTKPLFYFTLGSYVGDNSGNVFTGYRYGAYNPGIFTAEVKNVTVAQPDIDQAVATDVIEQIAAVAAYAINTTFYNCKVEGGTIRGVSGAAAIAGRAASIVMESCSSNAQIISDLHRAAGMVSNLRIYDTKKGADSAVVISNCTFSGSIAGPNDGSRGTGGIVGGVYTDSSAGEPRFKLPLYLKGCTFSGTIDTWATGYNAYVGGILGVVFNGTAAVLENNTVTGTITAKGGLDNLFIGGVLGGITGDYSNGYIATTVQNNDVSGVTLPPTDSAENIYVGTEMGVVNGTDRVLDKAISLSTDGANATYGALLNATLANGFSITNIGDDAALTLPNTGVTLHVQEGAVLPSLKGSGGSLNLYNAGTVGDLNGFGNIVIYANGGTLGNVTSETGSVTVGASSQASDEKGYTGNTGSIGDITAKGNVSLYRNVSGSTIGNVISQTGSVTIGQNNADCREYNTNGGTIGNVTAATSVSIYAGEAGSVAYTGEQTGSIKAGTSVSVGFAASGTNYTNGNRLGNIEAGSDVNIINGNAAIGDVKAGGKVSITVNSNAVGNVEAAGSVSVGSAVLPNGGSVGNLTSTENAVTIFNGAATIGEVSGQTGVTVNANGGTIGNMTSVTGAVTVGSNNQSSDEKGYTGNTGKLGNIQAKTNITVYRNYSTGEGSGIIGSLTSDTGSVTIGQNTTDTNIAAYNTNSGMTGNVKAATAVSIYASEAGKVAHDGVVAGTIEAGTTIAVGSTTLPNGNVLGHISSVGNGANTISIYNNSIGAVSNVTSSGTGTVTIGTAAVPNAGAIGDVSAPAATVTGYTIAQVGNVTALTDTLIRAEGSADSYTAAVDIVVSKEADKTLVKDTAGALLHTFEAGAVNLALNGNRKVTVEAEVVISSLTGTGNTTVVKNEGTIQSITSASTATITENTGTIGAVTVKNSLLTVSNNSGVMNGTIQTSNGNISISNKAGGTISGDVVYAGTGAHTVSITNANEATMTGSISNLNGSGNMTINNQNPSAPMTGNITNNTGALTLQASGYTKDSNAAYTGTISTKGNLIIGTSLGANSADKAINVEFASESATITANGNFYFYLKVAPTSALKNATVIATATIESAAFRNTVDFLEVALTSLTKSINTGTDVKVKEGNDPEEGTLGNTVTVTGNEVTADAEGAAYFVNTNLYVPEGRSVSAGNTLTLTNNGTVTILNYGTIGNIVYSGTGTLNIYNLGGGTIESVTSNGIVNIVTNTGTIGAVSAANSISVGSSNATGEVTNQKPAGQEISYYPGNGGQNTTGATIASLTAGTGNATIYRNVGVIGAVQSEKAAVQIGQNNATYAAYNTNAGEIGSVTAGTSVSVYSGTETGSVANGGVIRAGSSFAAGYNSGANYYSISHSLGAVEAGTSITVYQSAGDIASLTAVGSVAIGSDKGVLNGATIGSVKSETNNITIYNGTVSIAAQDSQSVTALGSVTIGANGGTIGDVVSQNSSVSVGSSSKKADTPAGATTIAWGNNSAQAIIGNITAKTGVTISRNLGTIGSVTTETNAVTIGQNTADAEILEYNANSGSIGSVTSEIGTVTIYTTSAKGTIATDEGQAVRAGSSVTIGNANVANGNQIGPVYAGTSIGVYNGEDGDVESLKADTSINISANSGKIGNVEAVSSINIGTAAAANAGEIGTVTSKGSTVGIYNGTTAVGNISGYTGVTVYANAATIQRVSSENGTVTVGASSKNASNANGVTGNAGTIQEIEAKNSVTIYRNTGAIETVSSSEGSVTVGQATADEAVQAYQVNDGAIGAINAKTNVNIYTTSTKGTIAKGDGETVTAGTSVAIGNTQVINGNTIGPVTAGTSISVGGAGKLNAGAIESLTTTGGGINAYNNATIGSMSASKTYSVSLTLGDGAQPTAITTEDGKVTITNTGAVSPMVHVTTAGGDVTSAKTGDVYAAVDVTTTEAVADAKTVTLNGGFSTLVHNGTGTVYLETKDTAVGNIVKNSTGEVKVYGSAGSVTDNDGRSYLLSLVQNGNQAEIYLIAADGNALPAGTLNINITAADATIDPASPYTIAGGAVSEKFAILTLNASGETSVGIVGTFTPQGGQETPVSLEAATVTVPSLIDRIDTVFVANAEEFAAAKEAYGWNDEVAEPSAYPVLAVMPVVADGLENISVQVDGNAINGVGFVAVDMSDKTAGSQLTATVTASVDGYPGYSGNAAYVLTAADIAKADTGETQYYYVTYRYMDAVTADEVEPVTSGESVVLSTPERNGYSFLGWIEGDSETLLTAGTSYTPSADVTLTASWAAESTTYTLGITTAAGGEVKRLVDEVEYDIADGTSFVSGTTVTLKANRFSGYRFGGWTVTGTENYTVEDDILTITMDGNVTVEASFRRNSSSSGTSRYINNVVATSNGSVTVSPRIASKGQTVTITTNANEGYELSTLTAVDNNNNEIQLNKQENGTYTFVMPASNVSIQAAFKSTKPDETGCEYGDDCAAKRFTDLDADAWYHKAVDYVVINGMMNGMSDKLFEPDSNLSRAMIVQVLYNLEGKPAVAADNTFNDVESSAWFAKAIAWAVKYDIVAGYGDGSFGPDDSLTREQMTAILYRYASYKGYDVSASGDLSGFSDASKVSGWAVEAMKSAVGAGLITGKDDSKLDPLGTATRAEVAQILMNFCENIAK